MNPSEPESKGIRLQAYLASCGIASRRACEAIILSGRASINGKAATELGVRVQETDRVTLDDKPVEPERRKRYIVLNKPVGVLSTLSDPHGRPIALDLLRPRVRERVYNIGRLDYDSGGLLLFTNDGDFAGAVGHPSSGIEKEYEVWTDKPVAQAFLKAFLRGIPHDGQILRAERAVIAEPRRLRIVLVEGRNREIRRAMAVYGLRAESLTRVRIGIVSIDGLEEGRFRDLTERERQGLLSIRAGKSGRPADNGGERNASETERRGPG